MDTETWIAGIGVGDIKFGMPISSLEHFMNLEKVDSDRKDPEDRQYIDWDEDISISDNESNGDGIDSIHVYKTLKFNSTELIGVPVEIFQKIVGDRSPARIENIWLDDEDCQQVYEFESLGAQVWVKDGIVVSICVGPIEDDAED
ncbi:MAG: hypothetical protein VYB54_00955 [Pseudomonadota bacterium]|nr:hypothetical protein [Pseudomonadota bacterium]